MLEAYKQERFILVVSVPALHELHSVLSRPRFNQKYGISVQDVDAYVALIREHAHVVPVKGKLDVCRDPKDNFLIELALEGRASCTVSRDEDVTRDLELIQYLEAHGVRSLTVRRFLDELDAG